MKRKNLLLLTYFLTQTASVNAMMNDDNDLLSSLRLCSHQSPQLIEGIAEVRVGHGIRDSKATDPQKIEYLIDKHKDHNVLGKIFAIIEGADLAIAYDQKVLLNTIRAYPNNTIDMNELFNLMRRDWKLITDAANQVKLIEGEERHYLPFLDQLRILGNQEERCQYISKGLRGIEEAITYIEQNNTLLNGIVSNKLETLTGTDSINLRIALFYITLKKKKISGESFGPAHLTTFYKGGYFGPKENTKNLLSQTSFYQDGYFYTPTNGYITSEDISTNVPNDFEGLDLVGNGRNLNNLKMVFTDCSGFHQQVVRQFHPQNERLLNRVMSYHLAAVYDTLANEQGGTKNILYDLHGSNRRPLKAHEEKQVSTYSRTINQLKSVYDPVLNPMQNIQPGDILIKRSATAGKDGHVMIVVDKDLRDPTNVTIVELTSGRYIHGYTWRDIDLKDDNTMEGWFHRVLRIKIP